jgi:drug/metabolite transporter (DMT)-like permease
LLVRVTGHEQLSARRIAGLVLGFAGVAALAGFDTGPASPLAVAAVGGVAICYALGPLILARYLADLPGLGVIAAALMIAAILYLPAGVSQWPESALSLPTWLSVGTLAVVCTAIAFVVFFRLVAEVGPARSAVITYVNPAVALLLGVVVLEETITLITALGFALILAGSVLATAKDRRRRPSRDEVITCEDIATPIAEV